MEATEAIITLALAQEHAERSRNGAPGEPKTSLRPKLAPFRLRLSPGPSLGSLSVLALLHLARADMLFPSASRCPDRCIEREGTTWLAGKSPPLQAVLPEWPLCGQAALGPCLARAGWFGSSSGNGYRGRAPHHGWQALAWLPSVMSARSASKHTDYCWPLPASLSP